MTPQKIDMEKAGDAASFILVFAASSYASELLSSLLFVDCCELLYARDAKPVVALLKNENKYNA